MESEPVLQAAVPAAHENAIWTMDWHPNGHLLCTGSNDHTAKFWARARPGMVADDLYKGYQRGVSELDFLRKSERIDPDDDDSDANEENVDEISKAAGAIPGISVPKEKAAGPAASIAIALEPPRPSRKRQRILKDFSGGKSSALGMGCMPGEVVATVVPEAKPKADISNLQGPRREVLSKIGSIEALDLSFPTTVGWPKRTSTLRIYCRGTEVGRWERRVALSPAIVWSTV